MLNRIWKIVVSLPLVVLMFANAESARSASIGVTFLETELLDGTSTLSTTLAGATVSVVGANVWDVDISGSGLGSLDAGYWSSIVDRVYVDDDAGYINRISFKDTSTLRVESDILFSTFVASAGSYCDGILSGPIPLGTSCHIGNGGGDQYFARWNYAFEPQPVPLPAALPLLGGALSILGFFGWRRKRMAVA